jgi:hypothetical protein
VVRAQARPACGEALGEYLRTSQVLQFCPQRGAAALYVEGKPTSACTVVLSGTVHIEEAGSKWVRGAWSVIAVGALLADEVRRKGVQHVCGGRGVTGVSRVCAQGTYSPNFSATLACEQARCIQLSHAAFQAALNNESGPDGPAPLLALMSATRRRSSRHLAPVERRSSMSQLELRRPSPRLGPGQGPSPRPGQGHELRQGYQRSKRDRDSVVGHSTAHLVSIVARQDSVDEAKFGAVEEGERIKALETIGGSKNSLTSQISSHKSGFLGLW